MTTITLDILNDKAMDLLKDLEALNIIRIQDTVKNSPSVDLAKKYYGSMTSQTKEEIDQQLEDLRNEWD